MELIQSLWQGAQIAITSTHLLWALAGAVLGTLMGVLPGFGASAAMALLLPLTFHADVTQTLIFFITIACAAMYGSSTASILLNIPGGNSSPITAMEGNRMALNGRAGVALATAAAGSFIGGTLVAVVVVWAAPWIAKVASRLGPADIFMLMVMAFGVVSATIGRSTLRGMTSLFLGLGLACVGTESISSTDRLTAGFAWLSDGLDLALVAVGLLVVAQVLHHATYAGYPRSTFNTVGPLCLSRTDCKRSWRPWLRGTLIGTPWGCVPIGGVEMPTYISYATERYVSRPQWRAEFGREGAIEGVAGPEAANNASVTAALIPLLAMGIPTSNTTAMMLGAFQNYGLTPGHHWFASGHLLVWALIASLFVGNLLLIVLNWPLARIWIVLLRLPRPHVDAAMLVLATASVYGMRQSALDLLLLYMLGLLGLAMRRFDFPVTPLLIGLVLGPSAEAQLRQAVAIGHGSWGIFVQQPLTLTLMVLVLVLIVMPHMLEGWARRRMHQARA